MTGAIAVNLQDFCDNTPGDGRWACQSPFRVGDWVYATDTRIVVRVPAAVAPDVGVSDRKVPPVHELTAWPRFPLAGEPLPILGDVIARYAMVADGRCPACGSADIFGQCPECDGDGEVEWTGKVSGHRYSEECRVCDGEGALGQKDEHADCVEDWACKRCKKTKLKAAGTLEPDPVTIAGVSVNAWYYTKITRLPPGVVVAAYRFKGTVANDCLVFQAGDAQGLLMGLIDRG